MSVREVLLLGNPKLYEICAPVEEDEIGQMIYSFALDTFANQ
jgi:hypothetical protein